MTLNKFNMRAASRAQYRLLRDQQKQAADCMRKQPANN